jgi:hypothetical protein
VDPVLSTPTALSLGVNARNSAASNCPQNPLDSRNENLPEKRIHRKYASRPGGRPRRVFLLRARKPRPRAAGLSYLQKKQGNTGDHSHAVSERPKRESVRVAARGTQSGNAPACADGDANCRLQKRAAIVSRLFFTMKIPTPACGGGSDVDVGRSPDRAKRDPGISQAAMMRAS